MIPRSERVIAPLLIIAAVLAINVFLFSVFPALQRLFASSLHSQSAMQPKQQIIIEYRKSEEKKETPLEQQIRTVTTPQRSGSSELLQFRFSPDLSVEGTGEVVMGQQDLAAVIFEEGQTDEPPVPVFKPPIPYPERARELEVEGVLEVIIIIDLDGKVKTVEVVKSPHSSITSAARKVISTWRFRPARNKGIPVRVRARQVMEFRLE